jgi:1-deoxy-D-xylulose-5-phosphate reductoisomerase
MTLKQLENVTLEDALCHPNWLMGAKVTVDSATLMNKGFEVIEAKWLFDLKASQIDVIVHPQSIVHSLVQFCDGSIKAQMGLPDMRLPIQYALSFPERFSTNYPRFNFLDYPSLSFEQPDIKSFQCLNIAYEALAKGGNVACVLNAANEVAVQSFLKKEIRFVDIPKVIEGVLEKSTFVPTPSLDDYVSTDRECRRIAEQLIVEQA